MPTLDQMKAQLATLQAKIDEEESREFNAAIAQIKELMDAHGITVDHLSKAVRKTRAKREHPPKYQDPESGATWTGMGRAPNWMNGAKREKYLIAQ